MAKDNVVAFYRCSICGNIVMLIKNGGGELVCCGKPMEKLIPNTSDGAAEKHVPVIKRNGSEMEVTVGSVEHPHTEQHYIEWIAVITDSINVRKILTPADRPIAVFDSVESGDVYAYCNLHGLWKAKI